MTPPPTALSTIDKKFIIDRQGKPAVLYAGLLDAAHRAGLQRISVTLLQAPNDSNGQTAICHAHATFESGREFEDIGDANPQNVGRMIAIHITRMAATRAKARALRDALNIGGVAVEELGPEADEVPAPARQQSPAAATEKRATAVQLTRIRNGLEALGRPIDEELLGRMSQEQAEQHIEALESAWRNRPKRLPDGRAEIRGLSDTDAAAALPPVR